MAKQRKKFEAAANRLTLNDVFHLVVAVACTCFGLKGFLLPGQFIDGGVTGISLITHALSDVPLPILIFFFNLPFIILGRFQISFPFALKTIAAIGALSLSLWLVDVPHITADPLLIAVFGGFFIGLGIGMAIRGGAVMDGTEVLAVWMADRTPLTVGDVILTINVAIFSLAGFFFGLETALYAMLTYLSASRTVDFILHGLEQFTAITIFSSRGNALYKVLKEDLGVEVTVMQAQGGPPNAPPEKREAFHSLYTVVSRLDMPRVLHAVQSLDPEAFVTYHAVTDLHSRV
jgi:uncharacterized membrane-anchored protein YitT (DUF2179 family)